MPTILLTQMLCITCVSLSVRCLWRISSCYINALLIRVVTKIKDKSIPQQLLPFISIGHVQEQQMRIQFFKKISVHRGLAT